jgi:hypothetical protein
LWKTFTICYVKRFPRFSYMVLYLCLLHYCRKAIFWDQWDDHPYTMRLQTRPQSLLNINTCRSLFAFHFWYWTIFRQFSGGWRQERARGLRPEVGRRGSQGGRKKKNQRLADYCDFSCKKVFFLQTNILCFNRSFYDVIYSLCKVRIFSKNIGL